MTTVSIKHGLGFAISLLLLSACSSNDKDKSTATNSNSSASSSVSAPPSNVTLSGEAVKGVIANGVVNAYAVVNGSVDYSSSLGSAITDASGAYSIAISGYDGSPVVVRVTAAEDGSTTMKCDLVAGCGEVSFGSPVSLTDTSFKLDAAIPSVTSSTVSVNLSVLTDTAAQVAAQGFAEASSNTAISSLIANANGSVANRFGIVGNLTQLDLIDITNPTDVAAADDDIVEYNLYNAGIVDAVLAGNSSVAFTHAANDFAQNYVNDGGMADTETAASETVTYAEILQQCGALIDQITTIETDAVLDLASLSTQLSANSNEALQGTTEPTNGALPPNSGETNELIIVKSMVKDLRNFGSGMDMNAAESFGNEIELAEETFDADAGIVFEAMTKASSAIMEATDAYREDNTLTSYTHADTNITVSISQSGDEVTYSVNTTLDIEDSSGEATTEVAVSLDAVDSDSSFESTENETTDENGVVTTTLNSDVSVDLSVTGSASSPTVRLQIANGSLSGTITVYAMEVIDDWELINDIEESAFDDFEFDLNIVLTEVGVENPISYTGTFNIALDGFSSRETEEYDTESDGGALVGLSYFNSRSTYGTMSVSISGEFASQAGESVSASLSMQVDGNGFTQVCEGENGVTALGEWIDNETCTEETESSFVQATLTLAFSLDLAGVSDDVSATLTSTRTALEEGRIDAELSYNGVQFDIEYDTTNNSDTQQSFTITNQAGAIATLTGTEDSDGEVVMTGNITYNGTTYATIDEDNGFVEIEYVDGTHVSL